MHPPNAGETLRLFLIGKHQLKTRVARVAVVQTDSELGKKKENLGSIRRTTAALAKREVDIACFPELATTGYALYEKWHRFSENIPGPTADELGRISREHGVSLIVGMPEREEKGKRFFDSAVLTDPRGDLVGVYRKVHLWDKERTYFSPGTHFPVFKTSHGKIGIGICYDVEFPEPARIMAMAGAELLVFPSAQPRSMRRQIDVYAKSRAAENCVFVAFANKTGEEGDLAYLGSSQVTSPTCRVLARVRKGTGYAIAELDFQELVEQRKLLPYLEQRVPSTYGPLR